MARRSVLFTPGDRRGMLEGAPDAGADALVFDLEDAVAPDRKAEARATVSDVLGDADFDPSAELFVRVNPVARPDGPLGVDGALGADDAPTAAADVAALGSVAGAIDGLVLPKVEAGADVRRLAGLARRHGLPHRILPLVESARGVLAAPAIAAASATDGLVFGAEDLAADLGAARSDEGTEVSYARQRVVAAASAHRVDAIDTLWTDFRDVEGLRADAARAVATGFDGKLAIHPDQVEPINDAFTPDEDERRWAARVLAAREEAVAEGRGVFAVDGEMIDAPLIARAERVVERARTAGLEVDVEATGRDG